MRRPRAESFCACVRGPAVHKQGQKRNTRARRDRPRSPAASEKLLARCPTTLPIHMSRQVSSAWGGWCLRPTHHHWVASVPTAPEAHQTRHLQGAAAPHDRSLPRRCPLLGSHGLHTWRRSVSTSLACLQECLQGAQLQNPQLCPRGGPQPIEQLLHRTHRKLQQLREHPRPHSKVSGRVGYLSPGRNQSDCRTCTKCVTCRHSRCASASVSERRQPLESHASLEMS